MATRCIGSGPGAPYRPERRLGVRLQDAFTTLSGLLGRGSGANRNRRKRLGYLLRFRSGIRCRSRRWERTHPRRFRRGNPFPRNSLTSPRIGRPFTCVMVARRQSRIARFSPAIRGAFRHARLRRWAVPSVSPSPGVNRGRGPSSPGATASLPSRRKRLAFRRLSPSVRVGASPDEAPKRLACAGWPAVRRAFAFLANRAAPLSPGRPKPPRGGRPNPTGFLSDPGGAGDSPRFSGRTPGPNWVPVRHCLSALPSGSASSGYPAIIDSRSGLIRQPNVSVRVASR